MRRVSVGAVAFIAAAAITATVFISPPATATLNDPIKIVAFGDSISELDTPPAPEMDWQTHLSDLLTEASVQHEIITHAHGGWRCADWVPLVQSIVASEAPDIVILSCGTNDAAGSLANFDATYSSLMTNVLLGHPPARILATWVQYSASRPALAASLRIGEAAVNDAIFRQAINSVHGTRIIGVADMQQIPEQYLDEGGIHPTAAGYEAMARIYYDALRQDPAYAWPDVVDPLCGMNGSRPGFVNTGYTPCTELAR